MTSKTTDIKQKEIKIIKSRIPKDFIILLLICLSVYLVILFAVRFLIEFIKEPQVGFEETMTLNMGQWLSIPFVLLGFYMLYYASKQKVK